MRKRTDGALAAPAIAVSLLPKAVCPICSPAYAAVLSSLGLGFIATTLLPVTIGFLAVPLAAIGFRASSRRGFGPLWIELAGSACVLIGKFWLSADAAVYVGVGLLIAASVWNPKRTAPEACHCVQRDSGPR